MNSDTYRNFMPRCPTEGPSRTPILIKKSPTKRKKDTQIYTNYKEDPGLSSKPRYGEF